MKRSGAQRYRRGDMFEKRRRLMADWAAFLARLGSLDAAESQGLW
jgi:hypothetical protein